MLIQNKSKVEYKVYNTHICQFPGCKALYANTQPKHEGHCVKHFPIAFKTRYRKAVVK